MANPRRKPARPDTVENDRSPLKDKPLRLPGQSLLEERTKLWDDKLEPWLVLALFMAVMAGILVPHRLRSLPAD
jgi:hypothetical protein